MPDDPKQISELYVVLGVNDAGQEGVACYVDPADSVMKPLCGNRHKVPTLLTVGKALANASGVKLKLVRFMSRGDLEVIAPDVIDS